MNQKISTVAAFMGYTLTKAGYSKSWEWTDDSGNMHYSSATHKDLHYNTSLDALKPVYDKLYADLKKWRDSTSTDQHTASTITIHISDLQEVCIGLNASLIFETIVESILYMQKHMPSNNH